MSHVGRWPGLLAVVLVLLVFPLSGPCQGAAPRQEVRVGILANRGVEKCPEDWGSMVRALGQALPDLRFTLVPLPFEDVDEAVVNDRVDFVVVNPAIYVNLELRYDVIRIATLINRAAGRSSEKFGGVFFTRADRGDIASVADLKGKRLAATSRYSLGGWLLGWHTLRQIGIEPASDLASLTFSQTHDQVVQDVLAGRSDAGTVRTDTLERMEAEGRLRLSDVKILTPPGYQPAPDFPFACSTRLVPEWPFAKLRHTPDSLARPVAAALLMMRAWDQSRIGQEGGEWTVPQPYESIHLIMRDLHVPPYENHGEVTVSDFIGQHMFLVAAMCLMVLGLMFSVAYFRLLNARLRQTMDKLRGAEVELTRQANTDNLTGLCNRKHFNELVEGEIARALRYGRPLAMIILDLDHFKSINDRFGHPLGDEVLIAVAGKILAVVRVSDFAARIGGEEFAVLMPETGLEAAAQVAERIRARVRDAALATAATGPVRCTVSIGVADVCPSIQNYSALYSAADQALYEAKRLGRDRVEKSTACML